MTVGEIVLESLTTGVITEMDAGDIQLGCRLPSALNHHQTILSDWIEPLGRRRHRRR